MIFQTIDDAINCFFTSRPVQVLAGHDKSVKCVALSAELDMAVSGSEDGTVNIYSIKEGQFMRFLKPPNNAPEMVSSLHVNSKGSPTSKIPTLNFEFFINPNPTR